MRIAQKNGTLCMMKKKKKNLLKNLKQKKLIIGGSAGAMNLGQKAICVTCADYPKLEIFKGLSLVPINIIPHYKFENTNEQCIKDFHEASSNCEDVFYMADDTALLCYENKYYITGENIYISKNKKISKYSPIGKFDYYKQKE